MALTGMDVNARHVMVVQGYHLVGRADNPVALAEEMVEFWRAVVREQRGQGVKPLRKHPSGEFRAATELLQRTKEENT